MIKLMDLSFDAGGVTAQKVCPACKSKYLSMKRLIMDRGNAFAVCFIEAHKHNQQPELYITAILGTWGDDSSEDHVTFACRYGPVQGQYEPACTLIDVPQSFSNSLAGKRLTRHAGLKHERFNEFWHVTDFLLESDMAIHDFFKHPIKNKIKTLLHRY